jgi:hypothetical protein
MARDRRLDETRQFVRCREKACCFFHAQILAKARDHVNKLGTEIPVFTEVAEALRRCNWSTCVKVSVAV